MISITQHLLFEGPNFIVTCEQPDLNQPTLVAMIVHKPTEMQAVLNGEVLETFIRQIYRWKVDVPSTAEVEQVLDGYSQGAFPLCMQ